MFRRVAGDDVVATFTAAGDAHGWPAATLTDNGTVYTARFTGGRNGLEHLLAYLGIRQKNGAPGHPQTQGKIERFHQTLKRWLARQPRGRTIAASSRPSSTPSASPTTSSGRTGRSAGRTPGEAYRATPKALPSAPGGRGHFRLRYDTTDRKGAITLRRAGRMHHLRIGAAHAGRRVLAIVDEQRGHGRRPRHRRDPLGPPDRARQGVLAQQTTRPRPMAGVSSDRLITGVAYDATHVSPMSRLMTMARPEGFEPPTV